MTETEFGRVPGAVASAAGLESAADVGASGAVLGRQLVDRTWASSRRPRCGAQRRALTRGRRRVAQVTRRGEVQRLALPNDLARQRRRARHSCRASCASPVQASTTTT